MDMRYQPQGLARIRRDLVGRAVGALFTNARSDIGGSNAEVVLFGAPDQSATPHGLARKFSATKTAYATITPPAGLIDTSAPYATVIAFVLDTVTVGARLFMYRDTVSGQTMQMLVGGTSRLAFSQRSSDGPGQGLGEDVLVAGKPYVACAGWDGNAYFLHINGVKQNGPNPGTISNSGGLSEILIAKRGSSSTYANTQIALFAHIKGQVDGAALSLNPWQLFEDASEEEALAVSAGADTALSGSAFARATATGTLSTSVRLVGSARADVVAGAALTSVINLDGAAQAATSGIGTLSSGIRLAGVIAAQSSASGQLQGAAVALTGGVYVQTSAGAALATSISLAGLAAGSVSGTGALGFAQAPIESIDVTKISPARIVVFEGSGSRVTPFESSGSRVTPFDSSGSRVTPFEGSGSKTVRFE